MEKNIKVTFGINKGLHGPVNEPLRALEPHAKFLLSLMLYNISMGVPRSPSHRFFCNFVVLDSI